MSSTAASRVARQTPRRTIAVIGATLFLNVVGMTLIIPVLPFLVGTYTAPDRVGLHVGLIVAAYALCAFLAAPILGAASDRWGRRPVILLSLVGSAAGYVVFGIGGALWVLYLGRVIDGLTAGNISAVFAAVADTHAPSERGRVYGLLGAVVGFAFMIGPLLGGLLGTFSPAMPLYAAAVFTTAAAAWVFVALPESAPLVGIPVRWDWGRLNPAAQFASVLSIAGLRRPMAASFCFFLAGAMLQSNFAVYLRDILRFGPIDIGWALLGVGVMDVVTQGVLSRRLLPRWGAWVLTRSGLAINAVGFVLIAVLAFVPTVGFLVVALFVFTLGDGLFQPAMSETIANAAPPNEQGRVQGANQAQQSLARMLGPLAPAALSQVSLSAPYWAGAAVAAIGLVALIHRSTATNRLPDRQTP